MSSLSALGLAFYAAVLIAAFAVRSAAGFGAVLIAVPMLAFVLPVSTTVAVASALTAVTSLHQVVRYWRQVAWPQFWIISFYTTIGIGFGFYFIHMLDERALQHGLGIFLVLYSLYALSTANTVLVLPSRWQGVLAAGAGISGGFCGALFGAGVGPIYALYLNVLRIDRMVFRVTMSTVMLVGSVIRIAGYVSFGFYRGSAIGLIAAGLPLAIIGSWVGDRLVNRFNSQIFGRFIAGLILLSGAALLLR